MFRQYNANPMGLRTTDCTVRAISAALGVGWRAAYDGITVQGRKMCDMPERNRVWGAYLRKMGFKRRKISDACPDCYSVSDFCREHPQGAYVLALDGHVVAAVDGDWVDTWDSGNEPVYFVWEREA